MSLRGLPIANTKFAPCFILLLMTGCQSVQPDHHPIPVYFDGTPAQTHTPTQAPKPIATHPKSKNNPKQERHTTLSRLFYLLENWF